jgi:transcriptional regulator with XRE-family HTH domain
MNKSLGEFIKDKINKYLENQKEKRKADLIKEFDITTQYLNDIENNKRVPSTSLMKKMANILNLTNKEKIELYDLASNSHKDKKIPADIEEYILNNKDAKNKIRKLMNEVEDI